jgi:dihydroorotate dehydrogenase
MLYHSLLRPILFRLPAESAHNLALHFLSSPVAPLLLKMAPRSACQTSLAIERFGLKFANPVGLAAGFDKDGIALTALAAFGFGFIEAGTVTYVPQPGNELPRLFRLPADRALINRAGFNNEGAKAFAERAAKHRPHCILGVSIGKSKVAPMEEAVDDYLKSFEAVFSVADYLAVNISSPNTPRLRELQRVEQLEELLSALTQRNQELTRKNHRDRTVPLVVKLAPDLKNEDLEMIIDVIQRRGIEGIIATNTTIERQNLISSPELVRSIGEGGLSGAPLRRRSTRMIANIYKLTHGSIPLIGVGGIFSAADAWEKICAGSSLIQIYTGLIYEGPRLVERINSGIAEMITKEGFRSLDQAIGCRANEFANAE